MIHRKMIPCRSMEALVTVTSYKNGVMSGVLRHPRLDEPMKFCSMSQFLLVLDSLLDLETCPNRPLPLVRPIMEDELTIATFQIQVLFRDFHTWQGRLVWKDQEQEASFRSVLELMQLLDEILET